MSAMNTKSFFQSTVFLIIFVLVSAIEGYKINITKVGNCEDVADVQVNVTNIKYDYGDDGLCDTIHGKYYVYTVNPGLNYELWITSFQCSPNTFGRCDDNEKHFIEPMHCDRLHGDDSGPWYMFAKAMKGSRCGERKGEFDLVSAKLLPEYLKNYLSEDVNSSRYRIHMLFHKKGEDGESKHPRACVNVEFSTIN